jgi:hypothetical protein
MSYRIILQVVALTILLFALPSCSSEREPAASVTQTAEPADAIGTKLMVALSRAKDLHHIAKVYMSDGNLVQAIAAVREILSLEFPAGAPEAEDVRNDARSLLAKLLVSQGQLDEAMRVVQEGIASSQRESFFVANLYTVKGEVHEARAAQLSGQPAVDEKHAAIEAFTKSNEIDLRIQKQLVQEQP